MPQSLSKVYLHIVFSTKGREPWLGPEMRDEVHRYLGGVGNQHECQTLAVGGTADHAHVLCMLGRTITQADLIAELKRSSSIWIKEQFKGMEAFAWQTGYGVFSLGHSQIPAARKYIERQKDHHRSVSFQDELRALLTKYEVKFDERYLWD